MDFEITITQVKAENYVLIGTNWPKYLRKLEAEADRVELLWRDLLGEHPWHEYKVPNDVFDPLTGFKRRISAKTREAMAERMQAVRQGK